jgi:hypothetical protein
MSNYIQEINIKVEDLLPENFVINANWKDHTIKLNELEAAANKIRIAKGEEASRVGDDLNHFKASPVIGRFLRSLEMKEGIRNTNYADSAYLENNEEVSSPLIINKRGRYGGTWAHPLVALRFAAWMDSDLEVEIYSQFLEHKIIEKRIESSDTWNKLRHSYSTMIGESFRFYHFVHIANAISDKLNCTDWDTADSDTLAKRTKIQDTLSFLMDSKVIKSREALLKTISKMTI